MSKMRDLDVLAIGATYQNGLGQQRRLVAVENDKIVFEAINPRRRHANRKLAQQLVSDAHEFMGVVSMVVWVDWLRKGGASFAAVVLQQQIGGLEAQARVPCDDVGATYQNGLGQQRCLLRVRNQQKRVSWLRPGSAPQGGRIHGTSRWCDWLRWCARGGMHNLQIIDSRR